MVLRDEILEFSDNCPSNILTPPCPSLPLDAPRGALCPSNSSIIHSFTAYFPLQVVVAPLHRFDFEMTILEIFLSNTARRWKSHPTHCCPSSSTRTEIYEISGFDKGHDDALCILMATKANKHRLLLGQQEIRWKP